MRLPLQQTSPPALLLAAALMLVGQAAFAPAAAADTLDGYPVYVSVRGQWERAYGGPERYIHHAANDGSVSLFVNINEYNGGRPLMVLRQKVYFHDGHLHGNHEQYRYHDGNAVLHRRTPYRRGQVHGEVCEYDEYGRLIGCYRYDRGQRCGVQVQYGYRQVAGGHYARYERNTCRFRAGRHISGTFFNDGVVSIRATVNERPVYRPTNRYEPTYTPAVRYEYDSGYQRDYGYDDCPPPVNRPRTIYRGGYEYDDCDDYGVRYDRGSRYEYRHEPRVRYGNGPSVRYQYDSGYNRRGNSRSRVGVGYGDEHFRVGVSWDVCD